MTMNDWMGKSLGSYFRRWGSTMVKLAITSVSLVTAMSLFVGVVPSSAGTKKTVPYGLETMLSGQFSTFGAQVLQGAHAATYEINKAGGVLGGNQFKLDAADDSSDPVDAIPPAHVLVNVDQVVAEGGEAGTQAQAVAKIYTAAKIPFLMPGGDISYDTNANPYIWRTSPSDSQLGVAIALWARHLGYTKAAMLFIGDAVEQSLAGVVAKTFKKLGGTIVSQQTIQADQANYSSEVNKIIASKAQVIISETDPPTESVVFKDFAAVGHLNIPTIGTDSMIGSAMVKALGDSTAHKLMTNVEAGVASSPAVAIFNQACKAATKSFCQGTANAVYDGEIIEALAIEEAGSTVGTKVNLAIPKVTEPGGIVVYDFAQGKKDILAGKRITYIGASGSFYFNKYHNIFGPFIAVKITANGAYKTAYNMTPLQLKAATG